MPVPYPNFASATTSIPLSQLDNNFATTITLGNVAIQLGNVVTSLGNVTLTNTTVTVGNVTTDLTVHGLTVGQGGGSVSTNTAVGAQALNATATGGGNTGVGYQADASITTGASNSAFGQFALTSNSTGSSNTGIGTQALNSNTTASYNTAVGYQAGYTNTTGAQNTDVGMKAGYLGTVRTYTISMGYFAGYSSNGTANTYIGYASGPNNGTASVENYNTGIGAQALNGTTTASNNTAVGYQALYSNLTGGDNVALGYQAGFACTYALNVFVGKASGAGMTSGYYNIYVGANSNASSGGVNNEVVLGYGLNGKGASTSYIQGSAYQTTNSAAWSITSDQRLKKNIVDNTVGLTAINGIKVRNFEYRLPDEITDLDKSNAVAITGVQLGPIAQELQQVLPDCVKTESTGVMSVDSSDVLWHLVTAVQQLSAQVTALQAKVGV